MTDIEVTEDPLRDLNSTKQLFHDDDEEGGAGIDYRRMFKGKTQKHFQKVPKRGEKDFEPDGTNKQQRILQEAREAMYSAFSFDGGLKQRAATGVWIEEFEMTHVPRALCTGPWFQNIGVGGPSGHWLLPEETLLMVSSGRMNLFDEDGLEMGVLASWGACVEAAGGVNTYIIYSQLRRAGYNIFRPGWLDGTRPPELKKTTTSVIAQTPNIWTWRQRFSGLYLAFKVFFINIYAILLSLLVYLPSWLVARPHRPYDAIYTTLPPIGSFSETIRHSTIPSLKIAFEVWRPNPLWKRKTPGPPNFHICVVQGRQDFPSLAELENLYNSIAQTSPLGGKNGKVVLAVVDNGVSNYLALDEKLLNAPS